MRKITKHLKEKIESIPMNPGIYLMKDDNSNIIYVGKAILLRKRVRQYFQKNNKSKRIENMVEKIADIAYVVTENEVEALVLECNYIKEHNPKFNVLLKDDKTYPYIKVTINHKYPTIYVTRIKRDDKALYFGPYANSGAVREVLDMLKKYFPIKRCKINLENKKLTSPCLYYHIGRCLGPCINDISLQMYTDMMKQVILFLQGKNSEIKKILTAQIEEHIEKLEFEEANILKLRLENIDKISEKQTVANLNENSSDILGYVFTGNTLYMQIFKVREHKIVLHENLEIQDIAEDEIQDNLTQIISRYYLDNKDLPKKLYVNLEDENTELLNEFFKTKAINLVVHSPKKGEKAKLVRMVENNININIEDKKTNVVIDLANILNYADMINSIECFDISNLKNEYIVGGMIRFEDGNLNKKMYRKFKIKSTLTQDDPMCMYEVLSRRLKHVEDWPLPDLFLIDGGKTQINAVKKAVKEAGLEILVYGMVKDNKHRTRALLSSSLNEIDISTNKRVLNFVTFLQDEVHRFTISYHRSIRDKVKLKTKK